MWLIKFQNGICDLEDASRSSWQSAFDDNYLKVFLNENGTPEFAAKMGCSRTIVINPFKSFGFT